MTALARSLLVVPPLLVLACGNPVGNPSLEGFESDPRVVQGDWVTVFREADGDVDLLPGELVPAGGRFLGSFDFRRYGDFWHVQFDDGSWDGKRVRFTATMTINGVQRAVAWAATFFPAEGGNPPMLLLSSDPFGGSENPIVYLRPRDVE